jgi:DeoR/GlpR family transcriptional regulator of sugar metabolism
VKARERRAEIGAIVRSRPASVEELADRYDVSLSTIRRDLARLSHDGAVVRTYGGALAAGERSLHEREHVAQAEKAAIARAAESYVRPGAVLLLDAGTTVGALATRLATHCGLTVVTTGLTTLRALEEAPGVDLVLLGGRVRRLSLGLVGPLAEAALSGLTVDTAFLGGDGVTADRGVCEGTAEQAALKRAMVDCAATVVVLADASKVGTPATHYWTRLDRPWTLITDDGASDATLAAFRARGDVEVVVAPTRGHGRARAGGRPVSAPRRGAER